MNLTTNTRVYRRETKSNGSKYWSLIVDRLYDQVLVDIEVDIDNFLKKTNDNNDRLPIMSETDINKLI